MPSTSSITLENVSKRFEKTPGWVLEDLSLDVGQGEFVSIVGASGCGKSTLLNLISRLDVPSTGTITTAKQATLMFQESALLSWLTARENVELPMKFRGFDRKVRKERATELLELVHLGAAGEKRPHELSGGMKQRVAIARALAQDAEILLMDEPFAALDAITRDFLHDELSRIWRERNLTVLFVTHNVREATRLGQRVLLMSSRPGKFIHEWKVDLQEPRRMDHPDIALMASEITDALRNEIRRHAHV